MELFEVGSAIIAKGKSWCLTIKPHQTLQRKDGTSWSFQVDRTVAYLDPSRKWFWSLFRFSLKGNIASLW